MNLALLRPRKAAPKKVKNVSSGDVEAQDLNSRIALKAYELYEKNGCKDGYDLDHWLEAERIVKEEFNQLR